MQNWNRISRMPVAMLPLIVFIMACTLCGVVESHPNLEGSGTGSMRRSMFAFSMPIGIPSLRSHFTCPRRSCGFGIAAKRSSMPNFSVRNSWNRAGILQAMRMGADEELWEAAEYGRDIEVERWVKEGADINSRDPNNQLKGAIHLAAHQGHASAIQKLLELGADPNLGTDSGSTALHFASAYGHADVIWLLLNQGANPTQPNEFGEEPLDLAKFKGRYSDRVDFVEVVRMLKEGVENYKKK